MHNKPGPSSRSPAPSSRLDWDDLRYVLMVARSGSLSGAARELAVTHSTVLRRIDAIEEKLQARLFERLRSGYAPTEAGDALRQVAEQCEPLVAEAERRIVGGDTRLTGLVRISTGPVVAHHLLATVLKSFCAAHPDIEVELLTSLETVDLSQREADIALRTAKKVPDYLVGRKLGDMRFRIYAWHDAPFLSGMKKSAKPLPLKNLVHDFPWIGFERDVYELPSHRWLNANVPAASIAIRADHFPSALPLLRTGMGVALMPEFVAADVAGMVALSAPIDDLCTQLWILTHPDLRNTARVRAFMQSVGDQVAQALAHLTKGKG
jgi:DNA-binding transcriptional LysR family regulator